jgi:hypothetical protein
VAAWLGLMLPPWYCRAAGHMNERPNRLMFVSFSCYPSTGVRISTGQPTRISDHNFCGCNFLASIFVIAMQCELVSVLYIQFSRYNPLDLFLKFFWLRRCSILHGVLILTSTVEKCFYREYTRRHWHNTEYILVAV